MGITYIRPLSEEDVKKLLKEAQSDGWHYSREDWWYGPKIITRNRKYNLTYICGGWKIDPDTGEEECAWVTPEEFGVPIKRMSEPDFDLEDMELAEIIMEELEK